MKRDLRQPDETSSSEPRADDEQRLPLLPTELQSLLKEALKGMRYGQVILIVQDGKVVQIDRTEKVRLTH